MQGEEGEDDVQTNQKEARSGHDQRVCFFFFCSEFGDGRSGRVITVMLTHAAPGTGVVGKVAAVVGLVVWSGRFSFSWDIAHFVCFVNQGHWVTNWEAKQ
jgi:hypothetical protein